MFDYERYYIPRHLDTNKIMIFDVDEFMLIVGSLVIGLTTNNLAPAALVALVLFRIWKRIKLKEYNLVKNLKYKYLYFMLGLKHSPEPYKKDFYG